MKYTFNKFSIDDSPAFLGITSGKRWNGWERPLFSATVLKQIAVWLEHDDVTAGSRVIIDGVEYTELDGWCWEAAGYKIIEKT